MDPHTETLTTISEPVSTTNLSLSHVYVSIKTKSKNDTCIDGVYRDENIAMLQKCKECIIQKWIINDDKFIS